jgi:hypothetical protein
MIQSFLVQLAMAILKYYAPIGVSSIWDYWKEREALKENKKKADDYQKVVDSPAGRDERRRIEDESLS